MADELQLKVLMGSDAEKNVEENLVLKKKPVQNVNYTEFNENIVSGSLGKESVKCLARREL